ncbi:holin [Eubacterium pyruvativorans]|uniref:holin n=1 Tax=Eubacterium pyruvativorans TaxID=155865 RepID=UPI0030B86912
MKERKWIEAAGIRAIKALALTATSTIGTAAALESVDWRMVLSASVLAAILSLLTSIAGLPELDAAAYTEADASRDDIERKDDSVTDEDIIESTSNGGGK